MLCINCKKETNNPKFCSRSCSVSYNNKIQPKRKTKLYKTCCKCDALVTHKRKYCDYCFKNYFIPNKRIPKDLTLKEAIYLRHHRSSAYALVRTRARTVIKNHSINKCQKCGYDKHIEACHIKSISSFSEDTLVSVINDINNLMALCPNCHWEFDHNE